MEDILKKTSDYKWIDIGAEVKCDEVIERKGLLSAQEVAAVLKESELGLINYEDMPIEKSGVFAAYAANGVVPVVMSCNKGESTYKPGVHYIEYNKDLDLENIPVNQIRLNLYSYYMEAASVSSHIKIIRELLTN